MTAEAVLQSVFGHAEFREGQGAIVEAVLRGRDVLGVLPTGSGKSLCYQLPALMLEGLTVVVSPLVALMKDQVEGLRRRSVDAVCIHSGMSSDAQQWALQRVAAGFGKLLYVAPERLRNPATLEALTRRPVALLAVDEAHCVSAWGHDFRPAFRALSSIAERLRARVRVALTATATPAVQHDIVRSLGLREPAIYVGGFFRPNLQVEVRRVAEAARLETLRASIPPTGAVIVYVATRAQAERVATFLGTDCYHAGLPTDARNRAQEAFVRGSARVMVATNAFGLGVDKADVRAVLHLQMPASLEAYYQEIGRGGRDGGACGCVLLYAGGDERVQEGLIRTSHVDPALADRLVDAASEGRLNAWRLHEMRGLRPSQVAEARDGLKLLAQAGVVRLCDFGRVEVRAEGRALLPSLARQRLRRMQGVRRMAQFARMRWGCRHRAVLAWFGQRLAGRCGACDLCG